MSFQTFVTQQLAAINSTLNAIGTNAKRIFELPSQTNLDPASLIHVSRGGISESLSVQKIIDAVSSVSYDQLLVIDEIELVDNLVTIPPNAQWKISDVYYSNITEIEITIPYCATGLERKDILVANTFNDIVLVKGPETSSGITIKPNIPIDTVFVTDMDVTDSTVGEPSIPIIADSFVKKIESQDVIIDYGATTIIEQINLIDDRSSISLIGSATDIKSVQQSGEFLRPGKPHFVKNRTGHDVTIWHLAGTGNVKYFFPNATNLVIKPNEVVEFNLNGNDSSAYRFEMVGEIDKEDISNKSDSYTHSSSITYASTKALVDGLMIDPNSFTGTDTEKIQSAVDLGALTKRPIKIAHNDSTGLNSWIIDEAILLNSNTNIHIVNSKLKLSDTSRDNVFRTINCGFGIINPEAQPLENISIIGIGNSTIEGADNPRATGDGAKTLSLTPLVGGSLSYGTDVGTAEKQTGDWRNVGILMAYTSNISVKNIKVSRMHCWAFSFERCSKGKLYDIEFDCPEKVIINGNETYIKNTDGIDLLHGTYDFDVQNITGHTGDDMVAMTIIGGTTYGAGTYNSLVTGNVYAGASDEIRNIEVNNVSGYTYANWVRVLNVNGTKVYNINVSNITDTSIAANLYRNMDGSGVLFGSNNVIYGGATPLGDCARITVDNVKIKNAPYGINIQGSLAESTISNLKKYLQPSGVHIVPIFFHASSLGARNLITTNIYDDNTGITDLSIIRSGTTGLKNGLIKDASGNYAFYEAGVLGNLKSKDATDYDDLSTFGQLRKYSVSTLTDLNSYRESGMFLTPNSGLTNLPSGWAQVRYPIIVVGGALVSYGMQLIVNTSTGELAYRAANNTGTFTSWTTSVPYKVYTAILNQTGTADPVATVLENTTGATVVWTRASVGQYLGTFSSGVLTLNKTIVSPVQALPPYTNHADTYRPDSSTVRIITTSSAANTDGLLSSMYSYVEIKVYN